MERGMDGCGEHRVKKEQRVWGDVEEEEEGEVNWKGGESRELKDVGGKKRKKVSGG